MYGLIEMYTSYNSGTMYLKITEMFSIAEENHIIGVGSNVTR